MFTAVTVCRLLAFGLVLSQCLGGVTSFIVVSPPTSTSTSGRHYYYYHYYGTTATTERSTFSSALDARLKKEEENGDSESSSSSSWPSTIPSRKEFLRQQGAATIAAAATILLSSPPSPPAALAFDGGVGGLGKTKPVTGVQLFEESSTPIQNAAGVVSAEITSSKGKPVLVEFQTPWPLLQSSSGLEARDLQNSESAFVQVIPLLSSSASSSGSTTSSNDWKNAKVLKALLMETVLASKGKFGAYGAPIDIKVKPFKKGDESSSSSSSNPVFVVTFTSYTPAMRESERQLWVVPVQTDADTLVTLVVGTTKARFASQEGVFTKIVNSYSAVAAPETKLRRTTTANVE